MPVVKVIHTVEGERVRKRKVFIARSLAEPRKTLDFSGQSVAVVGRAAYASSFEFGAEIDSHDVVIRINTIPPLLAKFAPQVGTRIDLIYTCSGCAIIGSVVEACAKHGIEWNKLNGELRRELGARFDPYFIPFTGTVAIIEALQAGASKVSAYFMDLYSGGNLAVDSRSDKFRGGGLNLRVNYHDPNKDKKLLAELLEDSRFVPDSRMRECLESPSELVHFNGAVPRGGPTRSHAPQQTVIHV
jgi:hypothetical protein